MQLLKPEKSTKTIDKTSLIIRIHDNQREFMPAKGATGDLSTEYLPQDKLANYRFAITGPPSGGESAWNALPAAFHNKDVLQTAMDKAVSKVSYS